MEYDSDAIYLDKLGDDDHYPDTWVYYRITSVTGLGNPEGTLGSSIEACRVKWPTLEDIPPVTETFGVVALEAAYDAVNSALRQWNIERERSIFIGVRDRPRGAS
jgi:hypothetical protein